MARAIVISKIYCDKGLNGVKELFKYRCSKLKRMTDMLIKNTFGVSRVEVSTPFTVFDTMKFAKTMKNMYQIIVYDDVLRHTQPYFKTAANEDAQKKLFIYYLRDLEHFVAIRTLNSLFNKRFTCGFCFR